MTGRLAALGLAALLLAGCETASDLMGGADADETPETVEPAVEETAGDGAAETAAASAAAGPGSRLPAPQTQGAPGGTAPLQEVSEDDVRDIYVALDASVAPTAVIFAIDQNRNGNPSDERAIRLSPENNECNPQELRSYAFPEGSAPVFSVNEARRGVTPVELPRFLAASVTEAMVRSDLVEKREETLPQNVCTRKLWEVLVQAPQARSAAAGQQ